MTRFLGAIVALVIIGTTQNVEACSCAGWPSPGGAYQGAQAVFIGSVRSVDNTKAKDEDNREWIVGQTATVQVEKVFKGNVKPEVIFKSYGSSCDAEYVEGQRWLFYTHFNPKEKAWEVGGCGRSTLVEHAADDLLFLQKLPKSAETTRISGHVYSYMESAEIGRNSGWDPLGIKITIKGEKTVEAYTDRNGVFEVYDLPPGDYEVTIAVPLGMKLKYQSGSIDGRFLKTPRDLKTVVRLSEKANVAVNFSLAADNRISGRVLGQNGRPIPRVCLDLLPVGVELKAKDAVSRVFDCTEPDGSYTLEDIPPGRYLISVNTENIITSEAPFPTTYYPGTNDRAKATEITMGVGDVRKDFDIQLATQAERHSLSGIVLSSDGRVFKEAWVVFLPAGAEEGARTEARVQVDENGKFELPVLAGLKGSLYATLFAPDYEYPCAETQKWVKAHGTSFMVTKPIQLEVISDVVDISFKLPVPYCEQIKAKRP